MHEERQGSAQTLRRSPERSTTECAIGQAFAGFSSGGCLVSIVVGFLGALIGMWLVTSLGLPVLFVLDVGGMDFPVLWSIVGAGVLVAVLGFLRGGRRV